MSLGELVTIGDLSSRKKVIREAATLLYDGVEKEYKQAKLKAAETYGLHYMPTNLEVALEIDRIAEEKEGAAREERLEHYDSLFRQIGQITVMARGAIVAGELYALGALMDGNHWLLYQLGVSSPEIERLVQAARQADALGAKLSGAGRGGNVIALVQQDTQEAAAEAMRQAGAKNVIATIVS